MRKRPISIILLIISISLFLTYYSYSYVVDYTNKEEVNDYLENVLVKEDSVINNKKDNYLGILEIPKINLQLGYYSVNSKENNVNKNIENLSSDNPDKKDATIILAAHSGNSYLGYFKNLDKLIVNDIVNIYYKNSKYIYEICNIYLDDKDGNITINKNINENILVLTTCSKNKNKQLILEAKLIKIV